MLLLKNSHKLRAKKRDHPNNSLLVELGNYVRPLFIGGLFALLLTVAIPLFGNAPSASAAACTKAQLDSTDVTYVMDFGTGNIRQSIKGYYDVAGGVRSEPTCQSFGATGQSTTTITYVKSSSDKVYVGGAACGTVRDTITLNSSPTNKSQTITGKIQVVGGSGGKLDPCKLVDVTKYSSVVKLKVSPTSSEPGGGSCLTDSQTFSINLNGDTIDKVNESLCEGGVLTIRYYDARSDNPLGFDTRTYVDGQRAKGYECESGYNGMITLDRLPSSNATSVTAKLQKYTMGSSLYGFGSCDPSGATQSIKIDIYVIDTSKAGEYSSVAGSYASRMCESLGVTPNKVKEYNDCITFWINSFVDYITECTAADPIRDKVIDCLIGKAPEVKDLLEAIRGAETSTSSSCAIDGIGWIICPTVNFLAGVADGSFGFLADNFLRTDPQVFNTTSPTYTAWSYMRTFANVVFVIVFIIIIFSQLTSIGVSNYGVKKMMPRIIVAAILVNMSYIICQLAVDISNILGYSLRDLFNSIATSVDTSSVSSALNTSEAATGSGGFLGLAGIVLTTAIVGVGGYALLSTFLPVILAAVIALIVILFILVARQALVVLLIVISPLAFVAFLLPNTENLFKQWRKMLTAMLLLFPIIAVVFGASTLASHVLSASFNGSIDGDSKNVFGQIIASAILVLPLLAVPILLKKSLDGIPMIGQQLGKLSSRANAGLGRSLKESYATSAVGMGRALRKQGRENYRKKRFAEKAGAGGLYGALSKGIPLTKEAQYANTAVGRYASSAVKDAEAKDIAAEQENIQRRMLSDAGFTADQAFHEALASGDTIRARAALGIKFQTAGGRTESHALLAAAESHTGFGTERVQSLRQFIASSHPAIDAQDNTIGRWSHNEGDIASLEHDASTYNLNDGKMAGQTKQGLVEAFTAKKLDREGATRILSSDTLSKDLKPDERDFLTHVASGGTLRPGDKGF